MKRILIIGASILQLPAIKKAKEMGMYVGVVDYDSTAVGIPYADEYFNVSTIDIDAVVRVAENFQPDGVFTLATDMPMRSVAAVCEKLNLPGITMDTAIKATDKGEMIKAFEANGVEHPWYFIVEKNEELEAIMPKITYPCISKPVDNSGSRGVMLIQNGDELREAVQYSASNGRAGGVIIEEFLDGAEVSVEIIVVDSKVHILQVTDKLTTGAPHFVEMGHSQPSMHPPKVIHSIEDLATRAVKAIGIHNGAAHVEIMVTKQGPKMIELGARMGGDCITTHLVPLSTGIDMIQIAIKIACGEVIEIGSHLKLGSAIRYFRVPCGKIVDITGVEAASQVLGVKEISFIHNIDYIVNEIGSSIDRIGFVITQAKTAEEAIKICENTMQMIQIEIEG